MKKIVCSNYEEMSKKAAEILADVVKEKPNAILGLPTGSTPIGMYKCLVEKCSSSEIDLSQVTTFNLDEYYPIKKSNEQSYDYFMHDNLFNHVNIKKENINIPNGEATDGEQECTEYEAKLSASAGLDIMVLGIGNNGHIGFNEPDNILHADTHVTSLTEDTIQVNSRFFEDIKEVPTKALTMGMGSILKARKIMLLISGKAKADIAKKLFEGMITTQIPATFLNTHPDVIVILDSEAASKL